MILISYMMCSSPGKFHWSPQEQTPSQPCSLNAFRSMEETGEPWGNPRRHQENIRNQSSGSNRNPWSSGAIVMRPNTPPSNAKTPDSSYKLTLLSWNFHMREKSVHGCVTSSIRNLLDFPPVERISSFSFCVSLWQCTVACGRGVPDPLWSDVITLSLACLLRFGRRVTLRLSLLAHFHWSVCSWKTDRSISGPYFKAKSMSVFEKKCLINTSTFGPVGRITELANPLKALWETSQVRASCLCWLLNHESLWAEVICLVCFHWVICNEGNKRRATCESSQDSNSPTLTRLRGKNTGRRLTL